MGKVGDFSRNFANTITMGFVETVERDLHGMDQTERDRLENSAAGQAGNNVGMVAGILLPGPGGKYKAANALLKHSKSIKNIVKSASKPGVRLSNAKIDQLRRVVEKAGGTLRTEIGQIGTMKGVLHSQVEGFGEGVRKSV